MEIICGKCNAKLGVVNIEVPFTAAVTCGLCGHTTGHSFKLEVAESAASQADAGDTDQAGLQSGN